MRALIHHLPPEFISWLGRLQFHIPAIGGLIRFAGRFATRGVCTIQHGPGKGLLIDNSLGFPGYALGTTEPEEQLALERLLSPGHVYWNVGANIGFHAILGARMVGKLGLVVAFEPVLEVAAMIRRNAALNKLEHLQVIQKAVCEFSGEVGLFVGAASATNSMGKNRDDDRRVLVPAVSLDDYALAADRLPNLISIDVECAEIRVLEGAVQIITRCRPAILLENHCMQTEVTDFFNQTLAPLGYRWFEIDFTPYRVKEQPVREHSIFSVPQ